MPREAIARMDWPALREAVRQCQACGLHAQRRQAVFGMGDERARWLVVGEGPGEQEDAQGLPFVGPSGQLLDAMLRAIGLDRQAQAGDAAARDPALPPLSQPAQPVFIANAVKCRPPGNRNPHPDELAHCLPYLQRQIALLQPRIILALGRFAVQSLLGSTEPLGRLRGRVHRYQGIPVIVSYHPAYLLRQPAEKARAWQDLCLAIEVAEREGAAH
jgi:DNA polymerase